MSGEEPAPGPALRTAPPTSYPADHLVALGLLLALAGFLGAGIAYGTILGPISIAFNDPLHTNPVTSAGKALMREAGPFQFLAALAALLLLSVSVVLKARTPSWLGDCAGAVALCGGVHIPRGVSIYV